VSEVGSSARGTRFRGDIQGLRALAVTVVVLFHAGMGMPGGFVGVDVFFVISGYVITAMLLADHRRSGRLRLGRFYLRRVRRLLPALGVLLTTVFLLGPLLGPRNGTVPTLDTGRAGALFVANIQLLFASRDYFAPASEQNPLLHLWTLSVEEQFYLAFPMLLLTAAWLGRLLPARPGRPTLEANGSLVGPAAIAVVLAGVASFLLALMLPGPVGGWIGIAGSAGRIVFYSAPTRAWQFLAGALLALVLGGRERSSGQDRIGPLRPDVWGACGLVLLAWAVLWFDEATPFPHVVGLVPVAGAIALLVGGAGGTGRIAATLSTAPARWLGDRSYSWYLWHWPSIVFAAALLPGSGWAPPAGAVLSLVPASLAYRLVEQPIRHGDVVAGRTLVLGAACVLVPMLVSLAYLPVANRLDERPAVRSAFEDMDPHLDFRSRCADNLVAPASRGDCTWPADASGGSGGGGRAVLLGDSNAGHLTEGFITAANGLSFDAVVQTRSGCPFADLHVRREGVLDVDCRSFYEEQMSALVAEPAAVVVLASAADLHVLDRDMALSGGGADWTSGTDGKLREWQLGLSRTVDELATSGVGIVVVQPVPRFTGWPSLAGCARLRLIIDSAGCGTTRATSETSPLGERVVRADREAVAGWPRVEVLDLRARLCPEATCSTLQDHGWVFRDESHITVPASEGLAPDLAAAITAALGR